MIFLTILQLNIWPDLYDSACDCNYNFIFFFCFWRVLLPNCAYQNFYSRRTFLACGYSSVSLSLHNLFVLSSYTPCVLDSSQPLSIPPESLFQCEELPHSSHSHNTTFHSLPSNFSRMTLGCLPTRLALIGYLQQWHLALPYLVSDLLFLMSCSLG